MTDSSDEQEKLEYVKQDLFHPVSRAWRGNIHNDDDDSNHFFMSEPSTSEADSSEIYMRLLSPMGSFTEDEGDDQDGLPPPPPPPPLPPPPARLLTTSTNTTAQSPASPGNTSLSSWESPHHTRRVHLHFSPDRYHQNHNHNHNHPREEPQQHPENYPEPRPYNTTTTATTPSSSTSNNINMSNANSNSSLNLNLNANVNVNVNVNANPPMPSGAKILDRSVVSDHLNSSNSTSPASEGQRHRVEEFLNDLRINSHGQVEESALVGDAANISFESTSSYQGPPNNNNNNINNRPDLIAKGIMRTAQHHARMSSMDTAVVQNTASGNSLARSAPSQNTHINSTDDTIVMTLSASEDEGAKEQKKTNANNESAPSSLSHNKNRNHNRRPLAQEQQNSAGDEKTAERPRRIRGTGVGGHRRQRSGDAAAASLSTGSMQWKGMEQDKIPLPPVPGEHEEDDDDEEEKKSFQKQPEEERDAETVSDQAPKGHTKMEGVGMAEIAEFSKFALGTAGNDSGRRQTRRRDSRTRKKSLTIESEESSSLASVDPSPKYASQGAATRRHSFKSGYNVSPTYSWGHKRQSSQPVQWPPTTLHPGNSPKMSSPYAQYPPNWNANWPLNNVRQSGQVPYCNSPQWSSQSERNSVSEQPRGVIDQWAQRSSGSLGSSFSWLSGKQPAGAANEQGSEMSPLVSSTKLPDPQSAKLEVSESSYEFRDFNSGSESSTSVEAQRTGHFQAHLKSTVNFEPPSPSLRVIRPRMSPFSNIGKSFQKADRRRFLPQTSALGDDGKTYPTYLCPLCKTRQREFFTVSNAPRQFESASGYIALYFGIYVIAALYIFGLQEGWSKLDCIYFAVLTLTTTGLGDFVPTSDGAKIMCSIFIYFGVACIGLLLGSYIAGMLDESSIREARANRIKSCPNCARIKNIKVAAERRRRHGKLPPKAPTHGYQSMSARSNSPDDDYFERDSKKVKFQHLHPVTENPNSACAQAERLGSTTPVEFRGGSNKKANSHTGTANDLELNVATHSPSLQGYAPSAYMSPVAQAPKKVSTSSPSTQQMLRRQSHSRHASLDLNGAHFAAAFGQNSARPRRKFSADLPATIEESSGGQDVQPPLRPQFDPNRYDNVDDDVSTSSETSSSSLEESVDLDDQRTGLKNAKYVFLTLREALVNSLVIIAFGSIGFCFIEGFSIIDSWYFTTVLLTTVGYGDLVPYTKGGKLFATVYILVAGTILLNNMSMISMIPLELRRRRTERAVLTQFGDSLDDAALRELATGPLIQRLNLSSHNPGGLEECTREMFSLAMLVRLGKVTEEDIKLSFAAFKKLDVHSDGILNSKSIIAGMIQRRKSLNLKNLGQVQEQVQQVGQQSQQVSAPPYGSLHSTSWGNSWNTGYGGWFGNGGEMPNYGPVPENNPAVPVYTPTEQSSLISEQSPYGSVNMRQTMQSQSLERGGFSH